MRLRMLARGSSLGLGLIMTGAAVGEPPQPALAPASPPEALAGPTVAAAAQRRSLVERDADGKIKRLEVSPAEAAVRLVNLGPEAQAKVDKLLTERAALLDGLVKEHLREIVEIAGEAQAGHREEAGRKLTELAPYAQPLRERGLLGQELAKALPEGPAREVRTMVEDYARAVEAEERAAAEARGEKFDPRAARRAEMIRLVGAEVRRSYERVVGQQAKDFESVLAELQLSPEQEGKVRAIVGDLFAETAGKSTPEQKAAAVARVWGLLTSEQRQRLVEHLRGAK